jgi:hypothetical protein
MKEILFTILNYGSVVVLLGGVTMLSALINPPKYRPYPFTKEHEDPRTEIMRKYFHSL